MATSASPPSRPELKSVRGGGEKEGGGREGEREGEGGRRGCGEQIVAIIQLYRNNNYINIIHKVGK